MQNYYWNDWYSAWGWFLWFGIIILTFSSFGNWGYTYRVHRLYEDDTQKSALDILNERYARGEIQSDDFYRMKSDLQVQVKNESSKKSFPTKISPA